MRFRPADFFLALVTPVAAILFSLAPATAEAQTVGTSPGRDAEPGWRFTLGAGLAYAPTYLGDDDYQLSAFPNLAIEYEDRFFASIGRGIGYNVINDGTWRIGPIVKYDFGRDEDGENPFSLSGDDTADLDGLGDVDGTVELGAFVEYRFHSVKGKVELRQGVGGHEGVIGEIEASYNGNFAIQRFPGFYAVGPKLVLASDDYNSAFFDVDNAQSAASGLSVYDADGGLVSYGIQATAGLRLTRRVTLIGFAGVDILGSEIADSSLVSQRGSDTQVRTGILLNYTF